METLSYVSQERIKSFIEKVHFIQWHLHSENFYFPKRENGEWKTKFVIIKSLYKCVSNTTSYIIYHRILSKYMYYKGMLMVVVQYVISNKMKWASWAVPGNVLTCLPPPLPISLCCSYLPASGHPDPPSLPLPFHQC